VGATKTESFTQEQNEMATLLKALGHPARVAIIEYLLRVDTCICGDIVNELPLAQATVSQHLRELKMAGWIKGSVEGTSICYCVNDEAVRKLERYILLISNTLQQKNACESSSEGTHCC
jgi:DNA-binding transcriptional ArsR family regulator